MCGIGGIAWKAQPGTDLSGSLQRMQKKLQHRGPDGNGIWMNETKGLVHTRLSILDLSESGRQPMLSADGSIALTYNGEIYNFIELRDELEKTGSSFKSRTDSEVILRGYEREGLAFFKKLNGIFAFAISDTLQNKLVLCRDPIGVKPFYYFLDSEKLAFSSEIAPLFESQIVEPLPDPVALDLFFSLNYIPAPYSGFQNIRQLMPGEVLVVDQNLQTTRSSIQLRQSPLSDETLKDPKIAQGKFENIFLRTLEMQTRSDVPVCLFLSGGIDSSCIAAGLKQIRRSSDLTALTFSFDQSQFDESKHAKDVATALGFKHEVISQGSHLDESLFETNQFLDMPFGDSSILAFWKLSSRTREQFKVALSGDGADESLAGYETYVASLMAHRLQKIPGFSRSEKMAPMIERFFPSSNARYPLKQKAHRFLLHAGKGFPRCHARWRMIQTEEMKQKVYSQKLQSFAFSAKSDQLYMEPLKHVEGHHSALEQALWMDFHFYLPNDMLVKVDRSSMAHGLEVRVPMLDLDLVPFFWNLPDEQKLHHGRGKMILRNWLKTQIPADLVDRPKAGFNVPVSHYFRNQWAEILKSQMQKTTSWQEYLNSDAIHSLIKSHQQNKIDAGHELYGLLSFFFWWNRYFS